MPKKIAIIGAGPAGCFTAQALVKSLPDAEITIIDRLISPYGLLRYGVAPDHQGTKGIIRQFSRLFEKQGVGFMGNIEVGKDVTLDQVREAMDAVVLSTGLYADRGFAVPGATLAGIYGAGEITRYWNAHPDSEGFEPNFGQTVAVLGNGNVAMDVLRLLIKSAGDFSGSDFDPGFVNSDVTAVHVIGRSPLAQAKFDPVMVNELGGIEGVSYHLAEGDEIPNESENANIVALRNLFEKHVEQPRKSVTFHSGWVVDKFAGSGESLSTIELKSAKDGQLKTLDCDAAVTAIGFESSGPLERDLLLRDAADLDAGLIADGLFATGWFKRGPHGTIPENRSDSIAVAGRVKDWVSSNSDGKPGIAAIQEICSDVATSYADWKRIDDVEVSTASLDRCRNKLKYRSDMLAVLERRKETA